MAFFRFEMDFGGGFQNQVGLEPEFWKAGFEKLSFAAEHKKEMTEKCKTNKKNVSKIV